ncbi:unnamed protein product [Malus baccata var. baccata]
MQACGGAAGIGSLQQPTWTKGTIFPNKGLTGSGFSHQLKLNCVKPVRSSSYIEGSLVAGRPSSSVSVPIPEIGGNGSSFVDNGLSEENFTDRAMMEAVGSCLTNKCSEGLPGEGTYTTTQSKHGGVACEDVGHGEKRGGAGAGLGGEAVVRRRRQHGSGFGVLSKKKKKKNQGPVDPARTGPFETGRVRSDSCNEI